MPLQLEIITWCLATIAVCVTGTAIAYFVSLCVGFFINMVDERKNNQRERDYEFLKKHGKWPDQIKGL